MLHSFSVTNFKNFKDKYTFDLSKINNYEFNPECIQNGIVNKALIYGYNGIGKSNLSLAIFDIIFHLTDKFRRPDYYINYLNADCSSDIADFHFKFKFGNNFIEYLYGKKSSEEIIYEDIIINDKKVISYDRKKNKEAFIDLAGAETLNRDLSQNKISVVKYVKTNTVLIQNEINSVLLDFFMFVDNMLLFKSLDERYYQGYKTDNKDILKDIIDRGHVEDFGLFLKKAGVDCILKSDDINGEKKIFFSFENKKIEFWSAASTGTRALTLFYYWLQRLIDDSSKPSLLFIDEFDAFYHMAISELIISVLKKHNCQVILTTHNSNLMSNDLLRPDCCFLMFKKKIESISNLTDKELRYAHNIEKMYRAGAFNE